MPPTALIRDLAGLSIYDRSLVEINGTSCFLAAKQDSGVKLLGVRGDSGDLEGAQPGPGEITLFPLTSGNAAALRRRLPWLAPVPLGLKTSAGFGDRLGMATPGHIRALRQLPDKGDGIGPIFAQQSVRENTRTGRSPQQVVDDATWGLFQEGWKVPWGADADHLKTTAVTQEFVAAGYTFFTIDPGDRVDDAAQSAPARELEDKLGKLPWEALEDSLQDLEERYLGTSYSAEGPAQPFDRELLWRYRHLASAMGDRPFDLEVSVDETDSTTTLAEHFYVASEMRRLGVRFVSLAPRFVGRFEKGVDYIGDLEEFSTELAQHAALARQLGPYKLSLHSGSDKFGVYPIAAGLTASVTPDSEGPLVHLKTAGTSYLEALRTAAEVDPGLFREILNYARERYEEDRATYHVSARLEKVAEPEALDDLELPGLLDEFDARQVLHVTFGSVLDRFGVSLKNTLSQHEEAHYGHLQTHFVRHLEPFAS